MTSKSLLEKWARTALRNKSDEIMKDGDNGSTKQTENAFLSLYSNSVTVDKWKM